MCKEPEDLRLKVMYSVNIAGASAEDNQHRYNVYTRSELVSNHIKIPTTLGDGETYLREEYKYDLQTVETQAEWLSVYKQCDALIAEAVNLEKVARNDSKIILRPAKGSTIKRRDRIIALQYGLFYAQQLEVQDFQYEEITDLSKYNFGNSTKIRQNNPFANSFNKIAGFGWGKRR